MEKFRKLKRLSIRVLNGMKSKEETKETKSNEETNPDFNFVTDFKEDNFSVIWRIENIHRCSLKGNEFFESPPFTIANNVTDNWTLRFYPEKNIYEDMLGEEQYAVGLYIKSISETPKAISFRCRFSYKRYLLKDSLEENEPFYFTLKGDFEFRVDSTQEKDYGSGPDYLFPTETLQHPQTLVIRCDIYIKNVSHKRVNVSGMLNLPSSLSKDLNEMYKSRKSSDITLHAKGEQFSAHKAILASRSEVFDAMFRHDMQESQTGIVEVEDIEPAVLNDMLQYIYSGTVDNFNIEKAMPLYTAANKYLLEELKDWCVDVIVDNLSVENICKVAVLVDLHADPKLKSATFNMFRNYTSEIFKKKEWQDLVRDSDHRELVSSVLQAVSADFITSFP